MHKLVYFLIFPVIWIFSKLPFRVLYIISDFIYFLFYYVVGYRRKVVLENLKLVFPTKTNEEIVSIQKKFFRHFIDTIIEAVKVVSISEKSVQKRFYYKNMELINTLYRDGKSIVLTGFHYGNWEWIAGISLTSEIDCYSSYTKIQNENFEKLIKNSRSKFGVTCLKSTEIIKGILKNISQKKQGLYLLISDQSPQLHKNQYWANFMGIKVPVFTGAEIISKKFDFAVVNISTTKIKRGYYQSEFKLITDSPKGLKLNEITDRYLKITEAHIRKQPEYYLWSHRRFKHKDRAVQGKS